MFFKYCMELVVNTMHLHGAHMKIQEIVVEIQEFDTPSMKFLIVSYSYIEFICATSEISTLSILKRSHVKII